MITADVTQSALQTIGGVLVGTGVVVVILAFIGIAMHLEKKYEARKAQRQKNKGEPRSLRRHRKK